MASGDTKTQQYLDVAANGTRADLPSDNCCNTRTQSLIVGVAERIMDVEDEVEEMKNNPDVADIVATYADLQAYDTSKLTDKDVIRVLTDSTHDDESTYYRYSKQTDQFTYIGTSKQYTNFVGTDGTSAGANGLVPAPAATDAGKFLNADGTWANETTYSNFTGTDGVSAGTAGLVPAPAATDAGKFLKADGTWDTAGGGGGGGMTKLSSANFNYDSQGGTNYDTVAIWLLDDGLYEMPDNYTTVPVKGALDGSKAADFNSAITSGTFYYFLKAGGSFWLFVNKGSQAPTISADRPLVYYQINSSGFMLYTASWQFAKESELPS